MLLITFLSLIILGYLMNFNIFYFLFLINSIFSSFFYQIKKLNIKDQKLFKNYLNQIIF